MCSTYNHLTTAHSSEPLARIGQGFCGTVWADATYNDDNDDGFPATVIKREDGGPGRSLKHELDMHHRILAASKRLFYLLRVNIPSNEKWLDKTDEEWSTILPRLPAGFTACNALVNEKIPPILEATSRLLVGVYGPAPVQSTILKDKANSHCLIRPYLGRRRHVTDRRPANRFFSLRNFPLHVDQMEQLGLDMTLLLHYASVMGDALAFLHWGAKVDGGDVEFVLAAERSNLLTPGPLKPFWDPTGPKVFKSTALGRHSMWMLDFDCCQPITLSEQAVDKLARAFWRNDPFYPRPGSENETDHQLWQVFRERYIEISAWDLMWESDDAMRRLPERVMDRIVETKDVYRRG